MKKFQRPLLLIHIHYFEAILIPKTLTNFEENGRYDQKMLAIKYFKGYIV